jgi:hypothetical protein
MSGSKLFRSALVGAAVAVLALTSTSASAGQIVQQLLTANDAAPWGTNLTFNKFNPSLGTLTGVQIDFKGFGSASAQVTHGTGAGSISIDQLGSTTQITAPGLIALTTNDFVGTQVFLWSAGSPSPTNFDTAIFSTNTLNVIGSSFWSQYTGIGTFDIAVDVKELNSWNPADVTGDFGAATFRTFGVGSRFKSAPCAIFATTRSWPRRCA